MSIEQGMCKGYVRTKVRDYNGNSHCYFWIADDAGKDSTTTVIMDAADCRNVAEILIERADELAVDGSEHNACTAIDENAEQIGKLQGQVAELQGELDHVKGQVTFLMGALSAAQETIIRLQGYEMGRVQERIDAAGGSVPK